jgi:hypothetical protein
LSSLLDDSAMPALVAALQSEQDAAQLARDLLDSCPALPVRLRRPLNRSTPRAPTRTPVRLPLRRLAVLAAASLAIGAAVAGGVLWARTDAGQAPSVDAVAVQVTQPTGQPTRQPTRPTTDWRTVVQQLDQRRDRAFALGDLAPLRAIYTARSKALAVDVAALRALAARNLHARGLRLDVVSVTVVGTSAERTSLHVVDRMPAYDIVDGRGRVAAHRGPRGMRGWRLDLARVGANWRIASVRAA